MSLNCHYKDTIMKLYYTTTDYEDKDIEVFLTETYCHYINHSERVVGKYGLLVRNDRGQALIDPLYHKNFKFKGNITDATDLEETAVIEL